MSVETAPELPTPPASPSERVGVPPTFCRACGGGIDSRAAICPRCGVAQAVIPNLSEAKSVGLAIFLSFLWPGVGHLYAGGDTEKGIVFTCISGLCFLMGLLTFFLGIALIPVWFATAVYTMIDSAKLVKARNRTLALTS
jgi:hypothetical protein